MQKTFKMEKLRKLSSKNLKKMKWALVHFSLVLFLGAFGFNANAQSYVGSEEAIQRIKAEIQSVHNQLNSVSLTATHGLSKVEVLVPTYGELLAHEILKGVAVKQALDTVETNPETASIPTLYVTQLRSRFDNLLQL
jgi:hypothetical protein